MRPRLVLWTGCILLLGACAPALQEVKEVKEVKEDSAAI